MKALGMLFFTLTLGFPFNEAGGKEDEGEKDKIFISYPLSNSGSAAHLFKEWKSGEELPAGSYRFKGELNLKERMRPAASDVLDLKPPGNGASKSKESHQGWSRKVDSFIWNPAETSSPKSLRIESIIKDVPINDYDELHIDYQDIDSDNPTLIQLTMLVSGKRLEQKIAAVVVEDLKNQRVILQHEDLSSAPWRKKNYSYSLKRFLGFPFDRTWRFSRKNGVVFFQNRFHLKLSSLETIDVVFKTDAPSEKINALNCNIRIGFESPLTPAEIMDCKRIPHEFFKFNGKPGLRIRIGDMFRNKFIKTENSFLDEIIFTLPQKKLERIQNQPVASIRFNSLSFPKKDPLDKNSINLKETDQIFYFYPSTKVLDLSKKRFVFPLRELSDKIGIDGTINNIVLSIQPKDFNSPAEFRLLHFRMVGRKKSSRPIIFDAGENLLKRWGGPFFNLMKNGGEIEWIKVKDFFPFNSPDVGKKLPAKTTTAPADEKRSPYFDFTLSPIKWRGVHIHSETGFTDWRADKNGLRLNGEGKRVEIDWPIQAIIDENTRFFINVGEGRENILDLRIIPFVKGRELPSIYVLPNKPQSFSGEPRKIQKLKIRISFLNSSFGLLLKEMAVFQPVPLKPSKVLDIPTLFEGETPLALENIPTNPENEVRLIKGRLRALLRSGTGDPIEVSWTTKVERKAGRIQGLKVIYKVPPAMYAHSPCWLHLTIKSARREVERTICPEESSDQIILPAETLFRGVDFKIGDVVQSIAWKIEAQNIKTSHSPLFPIDISVSLIGYDIRTIRNDLLRHPIFEWNEKPFLPTFLTDVPAENLLSGDFREEIDSFSKKDDSKANSSFNLLDHPHLRVESVILEKIEPISSEDLTSLTQVIAEETKNQGPKTNDDSLFKVFLFLLATGGCWWGWRQREKLSWVKWLTELSPESTQKQIRVWLSTAAALYLMEFLFHLIRGQTAGNIFLSPAGVAVILAWRGFIWKIRPDLESRRPQLASSVYRGPGTPYIAGFILTLVTAAFFLTVELKWMAEQIAVVGYFTLVIGVFLEIKHSRNKNHDRRGEDIAAGKDSSRA